MSWLALAGSATSFLLKLSQGMASPALQCRRHSVALYLGMCTRATSLLASASSVLLTHDAVADNRSVLMSDCIICSYAVCTACLMMNHRGWARASDILLSQHNQGRPLITCNLHSCEVQRTAGDPSWLGRQNEDVSLTALSSTADRTYCKMLFSGTTWSRHEL